ncbi:MAG: glycosyltransferase [Bacteroidales bacterium]|nr:glycosyltransferase [Bacteroidales bacterium]
MFIYYFFLENFTPVELWGLALFTFIWLIQISFYIVIFAKPNRYARKGEKGKIWYSAAKPNVSVIVYCNDNFVDIERNVISFLEQDYPNFEVVIVNDGSDNDLKDMVTLLKERYSNLSYTYVPEEAHSLSRKKLALTVGIKAAKYDIVGFTDAFCRPTSKKWLASMIRNFITDIDIVIGNSFEKGEERAKWSFRFYRLFFKLKFFSYAIMRRPYMGEGTNMFINKELFFKNRGFSNNLSIQYGEDDIFANEIMRRENCRVELSKDAAIENTLYDINGDMREMRLRRSFTDKILKTSAHFVFKLEQISCILFYPLFITMVIWGATDNPLITIFVSAMFVLRYISQSTVIRKASKTFNCDINGFDTMFYDFVRPIENIRFAILGKNSSHKNYTWRIRR